MYRPSKIKSPKLLLILLKFQISLETRNRVYKHYKTHNFIVKLMCSLLRLGSCNPVKFLNHERNSHSY